MGQPWVNLGSTLGQPSVNLRSTYGNLRTYLGPIFADFARVSGETEGLHGVLIRNDQFSNRETAFSGFVLDQSPLRAPWEKKKRIPNVSTVAPIGRKKGASTFLLPKKKNIWWRATIRGALAGRRSTLGQPSVNLGSTLGQPSVNVGSTVGQRWVNPRSTLGQRSVISLPISGRFSRILLEFRVKQKDYMAC